MFASIIALIVFIVFALFLIIVFSTAIIHILINGTLLWVIGTRAYVEIVREKKEKYYALGILIASFFLIFIKFRSIYSIWWITIFCGIAYITAQNYIFFEKKKIWKKRKKYI